VFKIKNIGFLILAFVSFNLSAQSVIQIEKRAFEAYKLAQYATAKVDFQQLLARDPESDSYNFHYAACLYHTENKSNARKYFEFVANRSVAFCDAHYYLGKIHHLSYRFNDAIASFKSYLACNPSDGLNAKKEITYCNNGNVLLEQPKSLTTLVAQLATKETFIQKFDIEEIGGKIYADPSLQTKADKKKAYIPICYYKRGDTYKFYASYGDDPAQLSLFYIQRISQDVWSKPTQLALSSPASDLVYPFFDSQAKRLYFSSNGFNSMGGFDLFSVSFDPETNTLGTVENLDFPFSSSADDFFFVPLNPSATTAWFASDRNVATGRIEALKVSYAVNAGNLIALSGQFTDLVNPKNTRIQIKVKDTQDGTEYGPFTSDDNGKYNMLLPGAGKYVFSAYIDGTEKIFENEQTLPDQKDNVLFKQNVKYSMDQGNELAGFSYDFKGGMTEEMKAFKANSISQLSLSARPVLNPTQVSTDAGDQENVEEQLTALNLGGNNLTEKSELLVDKLIEISNTGFDLQDTAEDLARQKNQVEFTLKTFSDQASRYKELLKGQDSIANQFYAKELIQLLDSIQTYELKLLENTLASQRNSKHIDSWNALNVEPSINALSDQIKMALIQENQDSLVQVLSRNQEVIREFIEYPASIAIQDVQPTSSSDQTIAELKALRKSEVQLKNEIARINDEKSQAKRKELEQLNADQEAKEKQLSTISSLIAEKEHEQIKAELANSFQKEGFTLSDSTLEGLVARVQKKQEAQGQAARIVNQTQISSVNSTDAKALSNQISSIKAENEVIKNRFVLANPQEQEALAARSQQLEARLDSLQTLKLELENNIAQNPVQPKTTETTPVVTDPTNPDVNPNISAQNPVQPKTTETTPVVTDPTNPDVNPNISSQNPVQPKTTETTPVVTDPTNPDVNPNISAQNPVQPKTTETTLVVTDPTNPEVNPNISAQNPVQPKTTETTPVVTDPSNPEVNPNISAQNPVQPKTTETTPVVTDPINPEVNPNNTAQNPVQPKTTETTPVVTDPSNPEVNPNNTAQNPVQPKTTETTPVVTDPTNPEVNPNNTAQNPVQPKTTETTPVVTDPSNPEVNPNNTAQNPVQPKTTETTPVVTDPTNPEVNPNISAQNPVQPKTTETTPVVTDPSNPEVNPNISAQNPVQPKTTETTPVVTDPTNPELNPNISAQNPVQPKTTETTPVVTDPTSQEASDNRSIRAINELDEQQRVISTMERENGLVEAETSVLKDQLNLANTLLKLKMEVGDSVYASVLTNKEIEGLTQGIAQSIAKVNEKLGNAQRLDIDLSDLSQGLQGIAPNPTAESFFTVPKSVALTDTEISGLSSEGSYDAYVTLRKDFASLRAKKLEVMEQLDELKLSLYRSTNSEETTAIISQLVDLADEIKKLERQEAQVLKTINAMPQKEAYHYLIEQGVAPKGGEGQLSFSKDQVVFSMNAEKKQGNSYPVLTSMPSGLVFRVQVGVFRKPVPDYFFREFTPVSGERLTNELTAYLTGFFASSTEAMNARGQVRNTGYSDAFIVAYCDGKRIPYQVALNYEKQGLCKVRNKQELESEAWSLMSAALSASTPVAEIPREVYYTVQVAALKNLDNGKLANVPELFYNESNMGLYKYSSGKFNQINLAKARKTALKALGYADAYIVAYRDGIPVSFKEAEVALAYKQEQPNLTKSNVEPVNKGIEGVAIQAPEKTYYAFTKEIDTIGLSSMAQYNRMQMFVLQPNSLHSAPIERQEISPLLAIFYSDFKLNLEGKEKPNKLSIKEDGDKFPLLHDFALRNQIPFRVMVIEDSRKQIDFYPSSAENSQLIYNLAEALTLEVTSN
jgi:hypothetical protein